MKKVTLKNWQYYLINVLILLIIPFFITFLYFYNSKFGEILFYYLLSLIWFIWFFLGFIISWIFSLNIILTLIIIFLVKWIIIYFVLKFFKKYNHFYSIILSIFLWIIGFVSSFSILQIILNFLSTKN